MPLMRLVAPPFFQMWPAPEFGKFTVVGATECKNGWCLIRMDPVRVRIHSSSVVSVADSPRIASSGFDGPTTSPSQRRQRREPEQVADGEHQITHKVSRILICGSRLKSVVAVRR